MASATSSARVTWTFHLVTGRVVLMTSASWKASVPNSPETTCPVMQTIGVESTIASASPVIMLVAPGPEVEKATPTFPEARAYP